MAKIGDGNSKQNLIKGVCASASLLCSQAGAAPLSADHVDPHTERPRVFIFSDIGNEPDDQMSLVRFLLYTNEVDVAGLVASTSTWQRDTVRPDIMHRVLDAYAEVQPNLLKHDKRYPDPDSLRELVAAGPAAYGMEGVTGGDASDGAARFIEAIKAGNDAPLWIGLWGGANGLAEGLIELEKETSPDEFVQLTSKLRVYSISDQDDAGPWIRQAYPHITYIVSPSMPNGETYLYATWTGIAGDEYYLNCEGADQTTVTNEWLEENVRAKGPMGAAYPSYMFMMEGDTPSFLPLIGNGLEAYRSPAWGGWGGRYVLRQAYGETRPIWTQGGDMFDRVTSRDEVVGIDGKPHVSDQATIWRWRNAFQNDFAARMDWTIKSYDEANHAPVISVAGHQDGQASIMNVGVGNSLTLDASSTRDPDGDDLTFEWFHYKEAGSDTGVALGDVKIEGANTPKARITVTAKARPLWLDIPETQLPDRGVAHVILKVTDNGTPSLTSYHRFVLTITD